MTHSPEPWTLETGVNYPDTPEPERWVAVRSALRELLIYDSARGDTGDGVLRDLTRIVACVNACRGIPTESLINSTFRPHSDMDGTLYELW